MIAMRYWPLFASFSYVILAKRKFMIEVEVYVTPVYHIVAASAGFLVYHNHCMVFRVPYSGGMVCGVHTIWFCCGTSSFR